tara:strand:- start:137 stop:556 length:420 start_codon:yes stop_codon:yes gene_type:complete
MNILTLTDDIILHILNYLNNDINNLLINKYCYKNLKKIYIKYIKSINILQKWWRRYRLPMDEPDYDFVTRKTLLRYYIAKYKIEWLQQFPNHAIHKLGIIVNNNDINKYLNIPQYNITTYMRNFCDKYMNKTDFIYYGW